MENEVYSILEVSPSQELFFLRLLTRQAMIHGLPISILSEILNVGETSTSDTLYYFIRLLLVYSHKPSTEVSRNDIIERLANLPINNNIINHAFINLTDIDISHPQVQRELLFTILAREVNREISIPHSLKRYISHITRYEI